MHNEEKPQFACICALHHSIFSQIVHAIGCRYLRVINMQTVSDRRRREKKAHYKHAIRKEKLQNF